VIPARYGSSRFPGKPLADILGKPMIQWVYERASQAQSLQKVVVATDDERILRCVREFGGEVHMTSASAPTGTDRVAELARGFPQVDVFVNIQGDEPLIDPRAIDQAVEPFFHDADLQVSTLVRRIEDPQELKDRNLVRVVFNRKGYALYFSRAPIPFNRDVQDISEWLQHGCYYRHIGVYVYRRAFLLRYPELPKSQLEKVEKLEQLRILENGYPIKVVETNYDPVCVDTPEDLERVRQYLLRHSAL